MDYYDDVEDDLYYQGGVDDDVFDDNDQFGDDFSDEIGVGGEEGVGQYDVEKYLARLSERKEEKEELKEEVWHEPIMEMSREPEWRSFGDLSVEWAKSRVGKAGDLSLTTLVSDPELSKIYRKMLLMDPQERFNNILLKQISFYNGFKVEPRLSEKSVNYLINKGNFIVGVKYKDPYLWMLGYLCLTPSQHTSGKKTEIDKNLYFKVINSSFNSFKDTEIIRSARWWIKNL